MVLKILPKNCDDLVKVINYGDNEFLEGKYNIKKFVYESMDNYLNLEKLVIDLRCSNDSMEDLREIVGFIKNSSRFDIVFLYTDETEEDERLQELINLDITVIKWDNDQITIDLDNIITPKISQDKPANIIDNLKALPKIFDDESNRADAKEYMYQEDAPFEFKENNMQIEKTEEIPEIQENKEADTNQNYKSKKIAITSISEKISTVMAINMCYCFAKSGINVSYSNFDGYNYIELMENYYKNELQVKTTKEDVTNLIDISFKNFFINKGHETINDTLVDMVKMCDELVLYSISPLTSFPEIDLIFNLFQDKSINLVCLNCLNEKIQDDIISRYKDKCKTIKFQVLPLDLITSIENDEFYKSYYL